MTLMTFVNNQSIEKNFRIYTVTNKVCLAEKQLRWADGANQSYVSMIFCKNKRQTVDGCNLECQTHWQPFLLKFRHFIG